nr:hypothetical protein [Tanacetum cinerariifolium]
MGYEKPSTKLTFYKALFSSQWNFLIHTILQSLSAKCTSWKEFSSAMASVVICLSTEDTAAQGDDTSTQGDDAQEPSLPSPTPPTPLPQPPHDLPSSSQSSSRTLVAWATLTRRVEHLEYDKVAQALEITKLKRRVKKLEKESRVKVLKLRRLKRVGTSQRVDTSEDTVMDDASNQGKKIDKLDQDDEDEPAKVREAVDVVTTAKLIIEVVTAASETVAAVSTIIFAAEPQVTAATITAAPVRVATVSTRRRKGVFIRDPKEESTTSSIIPTDTKSKDKGKGIMVEEPKPLKKKQQVEMDEEYARKLHAELSKDIDWDVSIDHVKQKAKEDPVVQRYQVMKKRPQTKAHARKKYDNVSEECCWFQIGLLQGDSINEAPTQKAAKRRKLNKEVEDLKRHLESVSDEDDDVYTEATPFARKSLVKERFSTSKPNNFSDDFLLTTLGAMFEKPDEQAQVWKNQRSIHVQVKVKSWKLLESCGVHIVTFSTTQLIFLVERRYPLSRFTLDQMLNVVRLRVEEESEMSLELLSAAKQKLMLLDGAAKGRINAAESS